MAAENARTALTKVADALDAVRAAASGGEPEPAAGAVPAESPLVASAHKAKAGYQKTARWVLAAFAAVGVLIFGSLPFAALADVDLSWPGSAWLFGSLFVAAVGITAAVIAVSMVSEPEDASLGELEIELRTVQKVDEDGTFAFGRPGVPEFDTTWWATTRKRWNPWLRSRTQLCTMLHGHEAAAHLGPGLGDHPTVTDLINKLGEMEESRAAHAPEVARLTVVAQARRERVADLAALLTELRALRTDSPDAELAGRLTETSRQYENAVAALDRARGELTATKALLAEIDDQLTLYSDHRTLVLVESSVMQMRGTFRLARRILAVAAILTLLGGTGYALQLPGATEDAAPAATSRVAGLSAAVIVNAGTEAATGLPAECVGTRLTALWLADGPVPPATGPFTVVVTDPVACRGRVAAAAGAGSFQLTG